MEIDLANTKNVKEPFSKEYFNNSLRNGFLDLTVYRNKNTNEFLQIFFEEGFYTIQILSKKQKYSFESPNIQSEVLLSLVNIYSDNLDYSSLFKWEITNINTNGNGNGNGNSILKFVYSTLPLINILLLFFHTQNKYSKFQFLSKNLNFSLIILLLITNALFLYKFKYWNSKINFDETTDMKDLIARIGTFSILIILAYIEYYSYF